MIDSQIGQTRETAMPPRTRKQPVFEDVPAWGVFVFESHHDANWRMAARRHDFLKLLYVIDGDGALETDEAAVELAAHDVAVVPAGVRHRLIDRPGKPMSLYVLCVAPTVWRTEPNLVRSLAARKLDPTLPACGRARGMMRQMLYEQTARRPGFAVLMQARAAELIVAIARAVGGGAGDEAIDPRRRIERYLDELGRRFFEATTIDDAAVSLGMSRRRFTELFREVAGESWLHRVQRLRIDHARRLLAQTDRTVLSIAFECGFGDVSSFYRAFSRFESLSPTEWRQAHRG